MKICIPTLALAFVSLTASAQQSKPSLISPDGSILVFFDTSGSRLSYTITDANPSVPAYYALDNEIALDIPGVKQGKYSVSKQKSFTEHFDAPLYKQTSFSDSYNQVLLKSANGINVEFRAYNSGVAYRFYTTFSSPKEWTVKGETAEFNFASDHVAYLPYSTNEKNPKAMAFQATYDAAPLSATRKLNAFLPATIDCGSAKVTILETDVKDYPGMFVLPNDDLVNAKSGNAGSKAQEKTSYGLKADFPLYPKTFDYYPWRKQKYVTSTEDFIAKATGKRHLPWRILAITRDDKDMPTNTLAYQLATPSAISGDTSWIQPGKVAWDWWNDWGLSGVDFKAGINQQTYKHYIDFASRHHLPYVILDEGWYNPKNGDMLTVIPELDLPALVRYGKEKGVGIILWTVFNVLDDQLDEACKKYSEMGIKGFKVDFLDRCDQEGMEMIYRIADRCAAHKLVLDYHGIFAPQGINRTYPNVINFEAVFGMEEVKWTNRADVVINGKTVNEPSKDMPRYDVTFPFIRGMAGYVDFTPGGMRNATKADFQPIYYNPMTMGTRCHQLAHYIVHDSPLTMLADSPSAYDREPECTSFISSLPTVYDEMRVIGAKMGEYIITARRKGKDWYVAGETNWDARTVTIDTSFLPEGTYQVTAFIDGLNAGKVATDYEKHSFTVSTSQLKNQEVKVNMASGGGFAAIIKSL